MNIYSGRLRDLPKGLGDRLNTYRYQVFVQRLGWELKTPKGIELDQFDRADTQYVVAVNDAGDIIGCARLLPTTAPYLLGDIFPMLLSDQPPPASPDIWELSRFAAMDLNNPGRRFQGQFSSSIAIALLQEALACAARSGAKQLISVSPAGIERLLRTSRVTGYRVGPPVIVDGHPLCACWLDAEPARERDCLPEEAYMHSPWQGQAGTQPHQH